MPLKLMYITNDTRVAAIAEKYGVDRIFADMEYIGKSSRQPGDTVKNAHTVDDVRALRRVLSKTELLVRVNPISAPSPSFVGSKAEIDAVIAAGADIIMLPMAKSVSDVRNFVSYVGGRAKTMLLLETAECAENIEAILACGGIDEVHIGLNDLHLSLGRKFMFELLADGTVDKLVNKISKFGIPYGFGGIARIGLGLLPSEYVITEHYRLKSSFAILSRAFCNINAMSDYGQIEELFSEGVRNIRSFEERAAAFGTADFERNKAEVAKRVREIVEKTGG